MNVGLRGATRRSACPVLHHSESGPLGLSVRECGAAGSASGRTACPVGPTLRQSRSRHGNASSLLPGCPSPHLLPVWMYVSFLSTWCRTSLPFDFLSVLVVQGGAVCLPTPPSWFSQSLVSFCHHLFPLYPLLPAPPPFSLVITILMSFTLTSYFLQLFKIQPSLLNTFKVARIVVGTVHMVKQIQIFALMDPTLYLVKQTMNETQI